MRTRTTLTLTIAVVSLLGTSAVRALDPRPQRAGIDEKLGEYVAEDLVMVNERGDSVRVGSLIDRPTILTLVYYTCPSVCRPLLNELSTQLGKLMAMNMKPGEDYRVITVSFDPHDDPAASAQLKKEYMDQLPDGFPDDAWTFLTSDSSTIQSFTNSVGFQFKSVGDKFVHPTTLIVLAPDGKITRYLYGAEYLPLDIKMALYEASEGRVGPTVARVLKFCFSYDPKGRKYVLNLTRVVGTGMILSLIGFAVFLGVAGRRRAREQGE